MRDKLIHFINEIATIMYVGGIFSHIVIGAVLGHEDPVAAYNVGVYKELSAYILILPGLALKVCVDLYLFTRYERVPNWLKMKLACIAFLAVNAFVFLVPMMPELVTLAQMSMVNGELSRDYVEKASLEQLIGASNALPLMLELLLGSFKPKLFGERAS
ncbi:enoyl-CoA hydratase [Vibrio sinaloensis]|uniref:enoyl-CoA hydratase n=1 Tax=Photobacterium sp. (strain ATCC 43367) TaxID=379097 RepID=UPI0035E9B550